MKEKGQTAEFVHTFKYLGNKLKFEASCEAHHNLETFPLIS